MSRRKPLADPDGRALTVRSPDGEPALLAIAEDVDKLVMEIRKWQRGRRLSQTLPLATVGG